MFINRALTSIKRNALFHMQKRQKTPPLARHTASGIKDRQGEHVRALARTNPNKIIIGAEPFMNGVASLLSAITDEKTNRILDEYSGIRIWADDVRDFLLDK